MAIIQNFNQSIAVHRYPIFEEIEHREQYENTVYHKIIENKKLSEQDNIFLHNMPYYFFYDNMFNSVPPELSRMLLNIAVQDEDYREYFVKVMETSQRYGAFFCITDYDNQRKMATAISPSINAKVYTMSEGEFDRYFVYLPAFFDEKKGAEKICEKYYMNIYDDETGDFLKIGLVLLCKYDDICLCFVPNDSIEIDNNLKSLDGYYITLPQCAIDKGEYEYGGDCQVLSDKAPEEIYHDVIEKLNLLNAEKKKDSQKRK